LGEIGALTNFGVVVELDDLGDIGELTLGGCT